MTDHILKPILLNAAYYYYYYYYYHYYYDYYYDYCYYHSWYFYFYDTWAPAYPRKMLCWLNQLLITRFVLPSPHLHSSCWQSLNGWAPMLEAQGWWPAERQGPHLQAQSARAHCAAPGSAPVAKQAKILESRLDLACSFASHPLALAWAKLLGELVPGALVD